MGEAEVVEERTRRAGRSPLPPRRPGRRPAARRSSRREPPQPQLLPSPRPPSPPSVARPPPSQPRNGRDRGFASVRPPEASSPRGASPQRVVPSSARRSILQRPTMRRRSSDGSSRGWTNEMRRRTMWIVQHSSIGWASSSPWSSAWTRASARRTRVERTPASPTGHPPAARSPRTARKGSTEPRRRRSEWVRKSPLKPTKGYDDPPKATSSPVRRNLREHRAADHECTTTVRVLLCGERMARYRVGGHNGVSFHRLSDERRVNAPAGARTTFSDIQQRSHS
ncbi:hypothetical protein CLV49_3531 [Labedella gwakjiensis]|uniref:Uncharacterized protein n=1 Tax=Labedella gwakjiensis TaxID=390269 RepID=A0A2P8H0Y5_9MICO|nr:hypothetical protein CLV49_3531 [Labedella gwakjiensis]